MPEFFWGIIAGAVIVLVAFLVPAILQISRTAKAAEQFIRKTQEDLDPLIDKLQENAEKSIQCITKLNDTITNVQQLTKAVGETGEIVHNVNNIFRQVGMFFTITSSGLGAGIKAALSVLTKGAVEKITSQK